MANRLEAGDLALAMASSLTLQGVRDLSLPSSSWLMSSWGSSLLVGLPLLGLRLLGLGCRCLGGHPQAGGSAQLVGLGLLSPRLLADQRAGLDHHGAQGQAKATVEYV